MSTRAQISVEDGEALVYKHGDGYPSGVFDILIPFVSAFWKSRGHDAAYFLARLVQVITNALDKDREDFAKKWPSPTGGRDAADAYKFLSCGIDAGYHGDIEWCYHVTKEGVVKVFQTSLGDDKGNPKPGEDPTNRKGFKLVGKVPLGTEAKKAEAMATKMERGSED